MANGFQFLAQPLAPDIIGAFEQGRARATQRQREQLADQEMQAKLGRENQFREWAGLAHGAQSPDEQQRFVAQAAAVDPRGAASLGQDLGSTQDRRKQYVGEMATVLTKLPPQQRPAQYQRMVPLMRQLGLEAPEQYTPEVDQTVQAVAQAFMGGGQQQTPSNVQEWEYFSRLPQTEQQRYIEMKRAQQTFVPEIGGVRTVVRPGVAGGETTMQPLSTLSGEANAAQVLAGAKQQGQANVDLTTKPAIAGATTAAQESAKSAAERDALQRQNQTAYQVYQQARGSLQRAMEGTDTGPIAGRLPAVTAAQQTAEGAQAAIAPVLKQLFRSSGEGVFTDKDQELLMAMVPTRTDHPEARNAKIQMIDQIVAAKLGQAGPSGSQRQTAPPPAAAQPQAGAPAVNTRGWQLMIDAQGNRAYVSPDGAQFEEVR